MRRLSDVSLRWKLFAAFGLVLLLFSAVSLAAYRTTLANVQAQAAVDETVRAISWRTRRGRRSRTWKPGIAGSSWWGARTFSTRTLSGAARPRMALRH